MSEDPKSDSEEARGAAILSAVERILASDEDLRREARLCEREALASALPDESARRKAAANEAIRRASNSAALSGALTALPALVPGIGTLAAVTGGALVDMAALLKIEVELSLVLTAIFGYDIARPEERRLAMFMAAAGVHDAKSGGTLLQDLAKVESVAAWTYAPREVAKVLATAFARTALTLVSRGFAKALPLIGIAVGSGLNKALTTRVGERLRDELERRRAARPPRERGEGAPCDSDDVVDAFVRPEAAGADGAAAATAEARVS